MRTTKCRTRVYRLSRSVRTDLRRYKIGDSFFSLPVSEAQELLAAAVESINGEVSTLEERLGGLRDEMQELKTALYGRFGKSINLEA